MSFRLIAACLLTALAGCQILGSNDGFGLLPETDNSQYSAGDTLSLTLINLSESSYTVHPVLCGALLHRRSRSGWTTVETSSSHLVCTAVGLELTPGRRASSVLMVDSDLESGRDRYEYSIYVYHGEAIDRTSRAEEIFVRSAWFEVVN